VYNNIAFGLRTRNFSKEEIDERVREAAEILGITDYLNRKPRELSGGQRQRVAIGRSIVRQPKVFLFDEPLSNLDAKMRVSMRAEISRLHKSLNSTMIYVTHDQTEAMTMGDRIVVLHNGEVMQVADPQTLYFKPDNLFVAGFIGSPQMNFFEGIIEDRMFKCEFFDIKIVENKLPSKNIVIGIRPENFSFEGGAVKLEGILDLAESLGDVTFLHINLNGKTVVVKTFIQKKFSVGETILFYPDLSSMHFFNKEDGRRVTV